MLRTREILKTWEIGELSFYLHEDGTWTVAGEMGATQYATRDQVLKSLGEEEEHCRESLDRARELRALLLESKESP